MSDKQTTLESAVRESLGEKVVRLLVDKGQLILELRAADLVAAMAALRDTPTLGFEQMIDACGVDYAEFAGAWDGKRYAVVYQLLSVANNWRLRVRVFCDNDDFPMVDSVTPIWSSANWFEREAFDLYGIVFNGHTDLRRILTDYGFVGHPFRKDFPVSGNVEMRYDPVQKRVVYQPVTIEPREIVPRVIREENYAGRK
jgi:NADH-quinone oxidoreductase subunit C